MKKFTKHALTVAIITVFVLLAIGSDSNTITAATNTAANIAGGTSETGVQYTMYNRSSHTVRISDSTGSFSIPAGGIGYARFGREASIYNVSYEPFNLVAVTQSGFSFTFTNR